MTIVYRLRPRSRKNFNCILKFFSLQKSIKHQLIVIFEIKYNKKMLFCILKFEILKNF